MELGWVVGFPVVVEVLRRSVVPVVVLALIGALVGMVSSLTAGARYTSAGLVLVTTPTPESTLMMLDQMPTVTRLVHSDATVAAAAQQSGVPVSQMRHQIQRDVTAVVPDRTLLIRISARGSTPEQARTLAEQVTAAFVEQVIRADAGVQMRVANPPGPASQTSMPTWMMAAVGLVFGAVAGWLLGLVRLRLRDAHEQPEDRPAAVEVPVAGGS